MSDEKCPTCTRSVFSPYRRLFNGKIVEGCIDASHDDKLYGESLRWHNRKEAKDFRTRLKKEAKRRK